MTKTPMAVAPTIWIAIRFVIFGVGGFLLIMVSWPDLESRFITPPENFMSAYLAAPLLSVGALMMLFGAGEWGRWAYLWVFASTPIAISSLIRLPLFLGGDKITGMLVFSLPVVLSYVLVRVYYRRQAARAHSTREIQVSSVSAPEESE